MAEAKRLRTGWASGLTRLSLAALLFESASGLAITLAPFHPAVEWSVLIHTLAGLLTLVPVTWYLAAHWLDYRRYAWSDTVLLGYVAAAALLVCSVSGLVVTLQGLFATRTTAQWRNVHLISTVVALSSALPHLFLVYVRTRHQVAAPARRLAGHVGLLTLAGLALTALLTSAYSGPRYDNTFPADYSFPRGEDRPFAPSLARTASGGALDPRSLSGSKGCGTSSCHSQIVDEWLPSAHRYAAMDPLFQGVQKVMAEQNGPESTRYCGGCHDPISLLSGSKNLFAEDLTHRLGLQEGVSCLSCHSIRETDIQGNANYVITQPTSYLWQWDDQGLRRRLRDFLIRTYPAEHNRLSKRMFKAPEYCAACHKQFVDQEVNRVGWVQLQNQYDNWKASHWYVEGEPTKTIECRECHMPLVDSADPAAGDAVDYNRHADDGKHRSHRFIAANAMIPRLLELPGWQRQVELTEAWLEGRQQVPEIRDKWPDGPVVSIALQVPGRATAGARLPIRVVLTSRKVGHDFPTGPLDIIQSWVELHVLDPAGQEVFASGRRDAKHFIEPGSFLFKAEPVDQYGNLIDRHNLWEMVGVRYRRALFPGYSDSVEYLVDCPAALASGPAASTPSGQQRVQDLEIAPLVAPGVYRVEAALLYRKVDQFLVNFLLGESSGVTAPVIEMARAVATFELAPAASATPAELSRSVPGGR
jgi:hypothetical protein